MLNKRTRFAITSGGDEPVLDSGIKGNSVFNFIFKKASKNNGSILRSTDLFQSVRDKCHTFYEQQGVSQTPQIFELSSSGHEGGDFVFISTN